MGEPLRVLFVESSADDAELEARQLTAAGFDVSYERVMGPDALRAALTHPLELIIGGSSESSGEALDISRQQRPDVPFVVVSEAVGQDRAVEAIKAGANDYVLKDNLGLLAPAVARALRESAAARGRERAARHERLLAQASAVLAESIEYGTTLKRAARLAVPELADGCLVDLLDDRNVLRLVALAHAEPEKERMAELLRKRYPQPPRPPRGPVWVAQTGQPQLVPEVTEEGLLSWAQDPEELALIRAFGLRSYICVPLAARGSTFGTLTFVSSQPGRVYDVLDLSFATELGRRIAFAVDNARLYARAQDAVRLRDDFLSVAAHELRTPLTTLQLQVQSLLSSQRASDERDRAKLERAARSTTRLSRLVDTLVEASRIASGLLVLDRQRLDLGALVREVVQTHAEEARAGGSQIELDVPADVIVWGDRERLAEALGSLLSNALKYGGGQPVDVRLSRSDVVAEISVRDRGVGIAAADLERIFGRFERAVSVRNYGGLGLGLYVTRQIVRAHQGSIDASSEPGAGATFTIRLPLAL
jgi:signal transduction histidine kinase/CheY-like chemotaxis protein